VTTGGTVPTPEKMAERPWRPGDNMSVHRGFVWMFVVVLGLCLLTAPAALAAPPAITGLSSSTHPSSATWYKSSTPTFQWNPALATDQAIAGYSYVLDQSPATGPDTTIELSSLGLVASRDLEVGVDPQSVILIDLNGDAILDIATANYWDNTVSVLIGKGGGSFEDTAGFSLLPNEGPTSLAAGDFNGDGNPDLVICNEITTNVCTLLGNGTGSFTLDANQITGDKPCDVAAADFNGDGKLDVVTVNGNAGTVSMLLGNGDGTLKDKVDYSGAPNPYALVLGDFNDDGKLDAATGNLANSVTVFHGNGDGTFAEDKPTTPVGHEVFGIAAADFNGDGLLDVVTANQDANEISILQNRGTSLFAPPVDYATCDDPRRVAVGDLNDDGKPDIVVSSPLSEMVNVLLGGGDGTFTNTDRYYGSATSPEDVAVGDLDGDGKQDVVVSTSVPQRYGFSSPGYVSIFRGDGDGTLQGRRDYDEVVTLGAYGQVGAQIAATDLNSDGIDDLAVADLIGKKIVPLLGGPDGFSILPSVSTPDIPVDIAVADFNNDGKQDVATANSGSDIESLSVALGDGKGGLAPTIDTPGYSPARLAVGDFDADGTADLAVVSDDYTYVGLYIGDGAGNFPTGDYRGGEYPNGAVVTGDFDDDGVSDVAVAESIDGWIAHSINLLVSSDGFGSLHDFAPLDSDPSCLATGDLDQDGNLDLVAVSRSGASSVGSVRVYLGDGVGTWYSGEVDGLGLFPAVADMNGDGFPDLVLSDDTMPEGPNLSVLLGNGDGTFGSRQQWSTGGFAESVAVGDFNGDGKADAATGNRVRGSVSVLLNAGGSPEAAFTGKADGTWYFHVRAVDAAGVGGPTNTLAVKIDATAPTPIDNADALWHQGGFTLNLSGSDAASGVARIYVNRDGRAVTLPVTSTSLTFQTWKRGGGSGTHTVSYRVYDKAGNSTSLVTRTVKIDGKPPQTANDAPRDSAGAPVPQTQALTVHLTPTDQAALSGVKETWWSLDGGTWTKGTSVSVPAQNGYHFVRYYSVDNAGNSESVRTCTVRMVISAKALHRGLPARRRSVAGWAAEVAEGSPTPPMLLVAVLLDRPLSFVVTPSSHRSGHDGVRGAATYSFSTLEHVIST